MSIRILVDESPYKDIRKIKEIANLTDGLGRISLNQSCNNLIVELRKLEKKKKDDKKKSFKSSYKTREKDLHGQES